MGGYSFSHWHNHVCASCKGSFQSEWVNDRYCAECEMARNNTCPSPEVTNG